MASQHIGSDGVGGGIFQKGLLYPRGFCVDLFLLGLVGKKSGIVFQSKHVRFNVSHVGIVLMWRRFVYMEIFVEDVLVCRRIGNQASNWTWIFTGVDQSCLQERKPHDVRIISPFILYFPFFCYLGKNIAVYPTINAPKSIPS